MNVLRSSQNSISDGLSSLWQSLGRGRSLNRGAAWGVMIVGALLAFEIFNYSTTEFALRDVLGGLAFAGLPWATVLAIAFCSIDFAGIARIFTPQQGSNEPAEVWYLFGAWLLAAAFNATLTWWGVSVAIVGHANSGSAQVLGGEVLTRIVPVFVAVMVWLIRVLIIGTLSAAGDRLFSTAVSRPRNQQSTYSPASGRQAGQPAPLNAASSASHNIASSRSPSMRSAAGMARGAAQPTYQSLGIDGNLQEVPPAQREHLIQ